MNIVFDIGGTNMRVAAANGTELGKIKKVPTPHEAASMIATLVTMAKECAGGETIDVIAGGIPGVVRGGVLVFEPSHLAHWVGTPFISEVEKQTGARGRVANDVALVGLGEAHSGAGRGSSIMAYVTVSTGVNGVRIVDGVIDHTTYGFEMGHQLTPNGELESLISGTSVRQKFGIEPKELESLDERTKLADDFAVGLYNSCLHWSPDTIVLGGSMITGINPIPLDRIEKFLSERVLKIYPASPKIKIAELGDGGGLHGAMILASQ